MWHFNTQQDQAFCCFGTPHKRMQFSSSEPYFTYCCIVWDSIGETLADSLQKLQNRAAHVITGASCLKHSADIRHGLSWLSLRL